MALQGVQGRRQDSSVASESSAERERPRQQGDCAGAYPSCQEWWRLSGPALASEDRRLVTLKPVRGIEVISKDADLNPRFLPVRLKHPHHTELKIA